MQISMIEMSVITVAPAGGASFIYNCMQMKPTVNTIYASKLRIAAKTATKSNGPFAAEHSRGTKNRLTGEQVTNWDKENSDLVALFNMSQCVICSSVCTK